MPLGEIEEQEPLMIGLPAATSSTLPQRQVSERCVWFTAVTRLQHLPRASFSREAGISATDQPA
jgi:hypothetical protein